MEIKIDMHSSLAFGKKRQGEKEQLTLTESSESSALRHTQICAHSKRHTRILRNRTKTINRILL